MTTPTVDPETIPEVKNYLEAEQMLAEFTERHKTMMLAYTNLVNECNNKLQAADKAVRARGVFCGPWKKHRENVKIDFTALIDIIGRQEFLALGGTENTKPTYEIEVAKVDLALATGRIPQNTADRFRTVQVQYSAPKPRVL